MIININPGKGLGLMEIFAASNGSKVKDGILILPECYGKGYIRRIPLGPMMSMMIHQYELAQELTLAIQLNSTKSDFITFSFRNIFAGTKTAYTSFSHEVTNASLLPSVQVSSGHADLEMTFHAKASINSIIINIHREMLKDLINGQDYNALLQTMIAGKQAFLFEEVISPKIRQVTTQIINESPFIALGDFFYKLKAQELIYFFLNEFIKRDLVPAYPVNGSDLKQIFWLRDKIIEDLRSPPNLDELSESVAFSESKMNRLSKQIFGTTIYNYHQKLRITRAAYLIKNDNVSVSEAGYQIGFSNLSHFSRIFEKHIGMKPKKYSLS